MLKPPEGYTLDATLGNEFLTLLNTEKDPAKLAQGLIELSAKANELSSEMGSQLFDEVQTEWTNATKADPEVGGPRYEASIATSKQIVERFGGPKLQEALELTGLGAHPEFVRFMTKVAPLLTEGNPVSPATPAAPKQRYTPMDLYPDQPIKGS